MCSVLKALITLITIIIINYIISLAHIQFLKEFYRLLSDSGVRLPLKFAKDPPEF